MSNNVIKSINFEPTERVQRLRERVFKSRPKVCSERAMLITESYQETEEQPIFLRRAMALDKILNNISTPIFDDEIIVGHLASERRSCPVYPEMDLEWLEEELETLETREYDQFEIKEEVKQKLREIFPYWKGKGLRDKVFSSMPEETKRARLESEVFSVTAHEETGLGHVLMNHEKVINHGLRSIIDQVKIEKENLDLSIVENLRKNIFYQSVIINLEAAIAWANRYGEKAKLLAAQEDNYERKKELENIAEVCSRVPEYPARNFQEALQSIWFVHLVPQLETDGVAITIGRLDQFVYPFLKKDLENEVITKAHAQEILDCFWLKFAEMVKLYNIESAKVTSGFPMGQNIVIGGTDVEGLEAVNELSYMCLDAHRHCRLYEPNFTVRINRTISDEFLIKVCENITMGTGHPVVFNEDVAIESLLARGIPLHEARDYAPIGCVENSVIGMWMRSNGGYFCLTKVLELALNNGKCQLTGKQLGPETGNLEDFKTFDDVIDSYRKQTEYFVRHLVIENNVIDAVHSEVMPIPFVSSLFEDCIANGKDVTEGGARYNFTCPGGVGVANTADGLAAINKLVFQDKKISAKDLRTALNDNFEGKEDIRLLLLNEAPKYGNDNLYVDMLARKAVDIYIDELDKHTNYRGGKFVAGLTAITANISFGKHVGATPDGRKAEQPLAEGISPTAGMDRQGPTAAMKSVTRIDHKRIMKGIIYNQKFNPSVLESKEGIYKFSQMIRAYCDLNGFQVQFNVISRETLLDAQENPDEYRDLVVRVAGYSAFYTELSKEVQDQIIARTEFGDL